MSTPPAYDELKTQVEARLGERAAAHSVAVSETAAELARVYGVDVQAARVAGLLHDWSREMTDEELLAAADEEQIEMTAVDRAVPYLLHAHVGASRLRADFPDLPQDVLQAVELHTMGSRDMTDLDRVVYVADMIEPERTFKGVDKLRGSVGEVDLQELFTSAYARSLSHLLRKRRRIHPKTIDVWNALVSEERA